ncbi:MAG: N-(5'-phosphoribosyl)anthranilate isomerase [Candidatus Melainabacteria bacterium]
MMAPGKTRIKICGITSLQDALLAMDAGADLLGFIFVPGTPRHLTPEQAADILRALPKGAVQTVGVFQDADRDFLDRHVTKLPLDAMQLHGSEKPETLNQTALPVIKRLPLTDSFDWPVFGPWRRAALWLLDPPKGVSVNWADVEIPPPPEGSPPVLLAGGLTPENVMITLNRFPWAAGVDVASGVEASPGRKDPDKVRAFCQTIHPPCLPDDLTAMLYPAVQNQPTD